jgi:hypothetical protein
MAKIYDKTAPGPSDHVIINAVREAHVRPFQATDWLDLRVGFFVSICGNADPGEDDTITGIGMPETITASPSLPFSDRIQLGVTDRATGQTFLGYTNLPAAGSRITSFGNSVLASSDIGVGTSNSDYYRVYNSFSQRVTDAVHIVDGGQSRAAAADGSQLHMVQNFAGGHAAGYCTLLALRFTRPDARGRARIITMQVKKTNAGHSSDLIFSSTPTEALLQSQLEGFPTTVNTLGPIEMSQVPDTFYLYWPFTASRLRIHCIGILKAA